MKEGRSYTNEAIFVSNTFMEMNSGNPDLRGEESIIKCPQRSASSVANIRRPMARVAVRFAQEIVKARSMCRDYIWAKICEVSANVSLVHQLRQKATVPGAEGATVVMLRYPVKYAFSIFLSLLFRSELTNAGTKFPAGPVRIPPLMSA